MNFVLRMANLCFVTNFRKKEIKKRIRVELYFVTNV